MDDKSKARLKEITDKPINEVTKEEGGFLRARRDFLKPSQLSDYKEILNQTPKGPVKKKNAKK